MDEFLNFQILGSPQNWLRVMTMAGLALAIFYLVARAIPRLVPAEK